MIKHLNNILDDLEIMTNNEEYKFSVDEVNYIKKSINNILNLQDDIEKINFGELKEVSNKIYDLNLNNSFSTLTDHISNELYAFEFLLQEKAKRKED